MKQRQPVYEVVMRDPQTGTQAFLVIDTLGSGVAGGGIRMMPTVTLEEVRRLAQTMTHKFSAIDVPMGGAKAGIIADPNAPDKNVHLEAFARMVEPFLKNMYIAGEDMGTTVADVGLIYRTAGCSWVEVVRHKANNQTLPEDFDPANFAGVNLEAKLTGFGVFEATMEACVVLGLAPDQTKVALQGFGTVGSETAERLSQQGFSIVTVADVQGTIHHHQGLPVDELLKAKDEMGAIDRDKLTFDYQALPREAWLALEADILIPAAIADTIDPNNVDQINAKLVVEAANIPVTAEAEAALFERGVAVVPDFIANAGAAGGFGLLLTDQVATEPEAVFAELGKRMRRATHEVLTVSQSEKQLPREVAVRLAERRLG